MATKTVTLTGAVQRVDELGGLNALIVNNTDAPLYASARAGIEPYADGVIEIKAGASRSLPDTNGTVYLLGSGGRAELTGTSAGVNFSVPSQSSGGGGVTEAEVDGIVTEKIAEVVANAPEDFDTLREIADWIDGHEDSAAAMNSEIKANTADISDIQEEQQTQNADISALRTEMEQKADISNVSNPNLLDNPDFKINQRGQGEYINITYTVDRWTMVTNGSKTNVLGDYIEIGRFDGRTGKILEQKISMSEIDLRGRVVTLSTLVENVLEGDNIRLLSGENLLGKTPLTSGVNSLKVTVTTDCETLRVVYHTDSTIAHSFKAFWAKLELGDCVTKFIPPHPALEFLKCQRYFLMIANGSFVKTGIIFIDGTGNNAQFIVNIPVTLRVTPQVLSLDSCTAVIFPKDGREHVLVSLSDNMLLNIDLLPSCIHFYLTGLSLDESIRGCDGVVQTKINASFAISADL